MVVFTIYNIVMIMTTIDAHTLKKKTKKDSLAAAAGCWLKVIVDGCG